MKKAFTTEYVIAHIVLGANFRPVKSQKDNSLFV